MLVCLITPHMHCVYFIHVKCLAINELTYDSFWKNLERSCTNLGSSSYAEVPMPSQASMDASNPVSTSTAGAVPVVNEEINTAMEWITESDSDLDDNESLNIGDIVKKLLSTAQSHKSFVVICKLNAVKNYLELV